MSRQLTRRIEYAVIVERLGTPQEARVIQETRTLPVDSESSFIEIIAAALGQHSNYVPKSLRLKNNTDIPAPFQ